jgi:hypothetical protein
LDFLAFAAFAALAFFSCLLRFLAAFSALRRTNFSFLLKGRIWKSPVDAVLDLGMAAKREMGVSCSFSFSVWNTLYI